MNYNNKMRKIWILILLFPVISFGQSVNDYLEVLKTEGKEPIKFVWEKLQEHDLVIFDDALHNAAEPFEFYQELVQQNNGNFKYIFLEVIGINSQSKIDSFLNNPIKDSTTLLKVFQDDFSGFGWRYKTYYNLLLTVREINKKIQDQDKKIQVIGVDQPIFWSGIHTRKDYNVFQESLIGRDYFMYKIILKTMENFQQGRKGIFLTNTRHAYKNIRNSDGNLYWNCGTFFYHWHPGKTYSIRIHNVTLSIVSSLPVTKNASTAGMERMKYNWIKMDNGLWDKAFELSGNNPVAFSLHNNVFGHHVYIGNHMLNIKKEQNMYDAYDALLFLAPLTSLHLSATNNFIYTETFKKELKRRINILYGANLENFLAKNKAANIEEFIERLSLYQPEQQNQYLSEKK